ncbi:P-loop containing nucleoside triphosphate hydrolase protein [Mycena floridula]|nr:P-loop containing nucleoside triphosphate hydrolase protein [Mycena floridula]
MTTIQKIKATQKNKATSYHLGQLKAKLATGGGGGGGLGFDVARTGIASVGFVGFPSVGKVPGTLKVHGAPVQILDLPGIIEGANDGRGRGRQASCNLIFIVLDVLKPLGDKKIIEQELEGFGIRLNKRPPAIVVRKKEKGGINITHTYEIKAILSEYKINNVDIAIREPNATADDLVDVIEGNR